MFQHTIVMPASAVLLNKILEFMCSSEAQLSHSCFSVLLRCYILIEILQNLIYDLSVSMVSYLLSELCLEVCGTLTNTGKLCCHGAKVQFTGSLWHRKIRLLFTYFFISNSSRGTSLHYWFIIELSLNANYCLKVMCTWEVKFF